MMGGLGGLQQQANLEDDDILRIRGQYGVDADEAKRIYDDMIYGYDRDVAQSSIDPSDWRILEQIIKAGGNPDDYIQSAGIMGALPQEENLMQQAKVYTNQDPGMIDEGYFWDDISPEAKAINKA